MSGLSDLYATALRQVFAARGSRLLCTALFAGFLAFYLLFLPAGYTGGRPGLVALRFLTPQLAGFAVLLALLASLTLTVSVHGFRRAAAVRGGGTGLLSLLVSLLPGLLCCTPVVPTLLAVAGVSATTLFVVGGRIQGIFATWELEILAAAAALMSYALHRAVRGLYAGCRISAPLRGPGGDARPEDGVPG